MFCPSGVAVVKASLCVSARAPRLHALHGVLPERFVCRLPGPPAAGDPEPTCSRHSGGAERPEQQPGSGEQGDDPHQIVSTR